MAPGLRFSCLAFHADFAGVDVGVGTIALTPRAVHGVQFDAVSAFIHGNDLAGPPVVDLAGKHAPTIDGHPHPVAVFAFVVAHADPHLLPGGRHRHVEISQRSVGKVVRRPVRVNDFVVCPLVTADFILILANNRRVIVFEET